MEWDRIQLVVGQLSSRIHPKRVCHRPRYWGHAQLDEFERYYELREKGAGPKQLASFLERTEHLFDYVAGLFYGSGTAPVSLDDLDSALLPVYNRTKRSVQAYDADMYELLTGLK